MIAEYLNKISIEFVDSLMNSIPEEYRILVTLGIYTVIITIYAVFILKFYKFLSDREIIKLNLSKYNNSENPSLEKFLAIVLFTIEYLIVLPFLTLFWFTVFSLFLVLLSKSENVNTILLISSSIIVTIRITAYIYPNLSKDISKLFPLTMLAIFVTEPDFFNVNSMITKILQIPQLFNNIIVFLLFIIVIEFLLRGFYSIFQLVYSSFDGFKDDNKEKKLNKIKIQNS